MNKKISTNLALGVIVALSTFVVGAIYIFWNGVDKAGNFSGVTIKKNKITACTEEAKICPDGSAVGRTEPNCDFAPCLEIIGVANKIIILSLKFNDLVSSPLVIEGKATGGWFFEGDFPVEIYDSNDKRLGVSYGKFIPQSEEDTWMTEDMVNFRSELKFDQSKTESGYLLFKKDNPSDLPRLDEFFKFPVNFSENFSEKDELSWRSYENEKLGFSLGFPDSWKGYVATESNQSNDQSVCFSFKDGHQPFCMMTIRVVLENDWNNMPNKSALTKITQDNGKVYFCDGCCGQKGDTGGGQFDKFQRDRCDEAEKILQTFELIIN